MSSSNPIQLKGNLTANLAGVLPLIDVAEYVSEFRIGTQRASVTLPANLKYGTSGVAAGERSDALTIAFYSGQHAADFWALLYSIISSDASEMDFSGNLEQAATSANNRRWFGKATLLSLDTGGVVGALRQQTLTLPIVAGTLQFAVA